MAKNPNQELIWQGRIHLGDEPGVYGDAVYAGISTELPITVFRIDPTDLKDIEFTLVVETEDIETYAGYVGHAISVIAYDPDPTKPYHSVERIAAQTAINSSDNNQKKIVVSTGTGKAPIYFSVRLRNDTSVNPGLYDDFVFIRLSIISKDAYAVLGFENQ